MKRRVSFITDEHLPKAIAQGLRRRGVDVVTVAEAGMLGATDERLLQRARKEARVMVSQDEDFLRHHAAGIEHEGIVFVGQETSVGEIIRGLMLVYQLLEREEMSGQIEYL